MLKIPFEVNNIKFDIYSDNSVWCFFDHDSTKGCLETISNIDCQDKEILDLGCGAGLLGIYAKLKGAKSVDSKDITSSSLGLTLINSQLNNVDINIGLADIKFNKTYDIIIANLETHIFLMYLKEIETHLNNGGKVIMTFPDKIQLENELNRANSSLKIVKENNLPKYKTFVLEVE